MHGGEGKLRVFFYREVQLRRPKAGREEFIMIEIIAESVGDALAIEAGGGQRIELVQSLAEGGLTPSVGLVAEVLARVTLPVNVMLRPHARSFRYSREDIAVMQRDALTLEALGVRQVVLGILDEEGLPDLAAMEEVLQGTNLTVTFHRAVDASADPLKALARLQRYDRVTHVLTSGGPGRAEENVAMLQAMARQSGEGLTLIVARGVSHCNLEALHREIAWQGEDNGSALSLDFHVGTGVREGHVDRPVEEEAVRRLMEHVPAP